MTHDPTRPVPDCSFKDLCLDAPDAAPLAGFWAAALGRPVRDCGDGGWQVQPAPGRSAAEGIWVDPVPEPRSVKSRVHLDLRLAAPDPGALLALGATVLRDPGADGTDDHWWVLADPDGNAFCAFPPRTGAVAGPEDPPGTPFELVVDARDAEAQASWWAERTGGTARSEGGVPWWWVEDVAGFPYDAWVFNPVPEPKSVKNRMHWDVRLAGTDPAALLAAGATLLREPDDEIDWWVLADPEGNEFCAFSPAAD